MTLSRMDLADIANPGALAKAILQMSPDMSIPVPIEQIARELDITDILELTTQGFEGALATDASRSSGVILVAKGTHPMRRRFTIGHELAHFLAPWHKPRHDGKFMCTSEDMRRASVSKDDPAVKMEVEANHFAVELLLPERSIRSNLRSMRGVDINHILSLARMFETSKEATARRYVALHDEPCGVVVSQNGIIQRFYKNADFPWIENFRKGSPLPAKCRSAQTNANEGGLSDMIETFGGIWFPSGSGEKIPKTFEQVLVQREGFKLTLLTIEASSDDDDDESDLQERWRVGFHKRRRS